MAEKTPRQIRSETETQAYNEGFSGYRIVRDGKTYEVTKNGLVPVKGSEAQETIKKTRKPRKPKTPG